MDERVEVYLSLDPEVKTLLDDNEIDLVEMLRREGFDISRGRPSLSLSDPRKAGREKEPVAVILATSALVLAMTPVILRTIEALSRKSVVVDEVQWEPVTGPDGGVIHDADGRPVVQPVTRKRLIESGSKPETFEIGVSGPVGLHVEFKHKRS